MLPCAVRLPSLPSSLDVLPRNPQIPLSPLWPKVLTSQNCGKVLLPRPAHPEYLLSQSFLGSQPISLRLARAAWLSPCCVLLPTL